MHLLKHIIKTLDNISIIYINSSTIYKQLVFNCFKITLLLHIDHFY